MPLTNSVLSDQFDLSFKVFHELMAKRVSKILLVSSPYDAFIMEEDGRLAERIIHEYRGLNLTRPPRLLWVSSAKAALEALDRESFDLVITMPRINDMEAYVLGRQIKERFPQLPIFLLAHNSSRYVNDSRYSDRNVFDRFFEWCGNTDLLLALIKSVEDRMNVSYDTQRANVRVIIMVEDSPFYCSSILPLLYKEIVMQTQAVMEESVNEEHRILRMRARPKILVAENFEEAENLCRHYRQYLLNVISDVRYPRGGEIDDQAGFLLLSMIKAENPDIPLLMFSSDEANRNRAEALPAVFLNKNSPFLHTDIRNFFMEHLGFGDFIFRLPDGTEIARSSNLRKMIEVLPSVPDESVYYHAFRNDFSSWLMARSEILLAVKLKPIKVSDFSSISEVKKFLINIIQERRKGRQKGLITDFASGDFDPDADFIKIGKGSLGGKARGLAFISTQLRNNPEILKKYENVNLCVPKTVVISTEGFDAFIEENNLGDLSKSDLSDELIIQSFLDAKVPEWLRHNIELFLAQARYPLAVRSSSLLEDSQFQPFAGIYKTYMIPNSDSDLSKRTTQLMNAVKLVYASTYLEAPRSYARRTQHRTEEEKMAVVIQKLTGVADGSYFYPALSGVAQSYNYYPISYMKPEEGIAYIALGLGKTVVEGGTSLRFSPKYPEFIPQFSGVDNMLANAQRYFYALTMDAFPDNFGFEEDGTLARLEVEDAAGHPVVKSLCSSYSHEDHRIRDSANAAGHLVLTFAQVLKYQSFPLSEILADVLELGRKGMGTPVEIEFAVDHPFAADRRPEFAFLQIRPMGLSSSQMAVEIEPQDMTEAFCFSTSAMGNGIYQDLEDIIFVKPEAFDSARTIDIAAEIGAVNKRLEPESRRFLLIGPGRWGSADRWLGIPVHWKDISGVSTIVETASDVLKADPSHGTHFFHNITSLGISYITVTRNGRDFIDWDWLNSIPAETETTFVKHVRLEKPMTIMIDGKRSKAVLKP
jgi:CheY-like chemotaxis protein